MREKRTKAVISSIQQKINNEANHNYLENHY